MTAIDRREFLKSAGTAGAASAFVQVPGGPVDDRAYWVSALTRIAEPVVSNLAAGTLKARMPVEQQANTDRRSVTHLEAFGRLIAGISPWLELPATGDAEGRLRARYLDLSRRSLAQVVNPDSADAMNFTNDRQPLVDAAFLAQGILRAPTALRGALDSTTRQRLIAALQSTRSVLAGFNNWLLFAATVEVGLKSLGAAWDRTRVDYALRQHDQWYKGDGLYGDGPDFHFDFYNSFVIHPMLVDVLDGVRGESPAWDEIARRENDRARRYAAILERLIAPDGSFPPVGRSIAYRCGAFHLLAQSALRRALPAGLGAGQARGALTAVIRRTLEPAGTFDTNGWLTIGLCGHQPGIGETYISTGSLYLCAVAFLPLGLPATDPFWAERSEPWTSARAWSGKPFPIDKAL